MPKMNYMRRLSEISKGSFSLNRQRAIGIEGCFILEVVSFVEVSKQTIKKVTLVIFSSGQLMQVPRTYIL